MKEQHAKRPVKFEVSQEFYERLHDEKLRRNLTLQQIMLRALERYLAVAESVHREIEEEGYRTGRSVEDVSRDIARTCIRTFREARGADAGIELPRRPPEVLEQMNKILEPLDLIDAIGEYLSDMPVEKIRSVKESLAIDLKYYRSARIKATKLGREQK